MLIRILYHNEVRAQFRLALKLHCTLKYVGPATGNSVLQKDLHSICDIGNGDPQFSELAKKFLADLDINGVFGIIRTRKAIKAFMEASKAVYSKTIEERAQKELPGQVASSSNGNEIEMDVFSVSSEITQSSANRFYVIPLSRITFTESELGSGAYGAVTLGYIKLKGEPLTVAIKSPLEGMAQLYRDCLKRETTVMMYVGHHVNVLKLLGTVLNGDRVSAVLEHCAFGSLQSYLHCRRIYFRRYNEPLDKGAEAVDEERSRISPDATRSDGYTGPGRHIKIDNDEVLTELDLLFYAYQIANGMEYLVTNNIIHRDVALRNMLLTDLYIVKISDFGLARRHEVSRGSDQHVPFKWYPPDAIINEDYTGSNIWSFGVALWELFTMGRDPCTHISNPTDLVQALADGWRLEAPEYCPSEVYSLIMLQCWHNNKLIAHHSTFAKLIVSYLQPLKQYRPNIGMILWSFSVQCPRNLAACNQATRASTMLITRLNTKGYDVCET